MKTTGFIALGALMAIPAACLGCGASGNDEDIAQFAVGNLTFTPTRDWYVRDPSADGSKADWIHVMYPIAGVEYMFFLYAH